MAITLRNSKGSPLTHNELDANFQEFYYSASYSDYEIKLFKSKSLEDEFTVPVNLAKGPKHSIQIKFGSGSVGELARATGSSNFTYDFTTDQLSLTGSADISGNVVVGGTITAEEFITERVATSYIYKSGSTKFGDSSDDNHAFTGSLQVAGNITTNGGLTGSLLATNNVVSASAQLASDISGSLSNTAIAALGAGILSSSAGIANLGVGILSSSAGIANLGAGILSSSAGIANLGSGIISSSAQISADISGSYVLTNAKIQELGAGIISASAQAVSILDGQDINLGRVTSTEMITNIISSSVQLASGSNTFGDAAGDRHEFTGSVHMSSTLSIEGFPNVSQSLASAVAGTGIQNVEEDTTPQLGGNLDLNSNNISGSGTIDISGDISGSSMLIAGDIDATGDITAYYSSDNRLKDNITPIEGALDKINQIGGYEFDWNSNSSHSGHDVGVIAQEIEAVLPEVVATRDNGYKAVRYEKIVALLIQALKEQQSQIQDLQSRL